MSSIFLQPHLHVARWRNGEPLNALLPDEEPTVRDAVEKRRVEFAAGRHCARKALATLGYSSFALLKGTHGEPLWPAGIVGSVSHCAGHSTAAAARAEHYAAVGIDDIELAREMSAEVLRRVTLPVEREWLAQAAPGQHWAHLFFSAKESLYKAWYPLARRWLGFQDAHIQFDPLTQTFTAKILQQQVPRIFAEEVRGWYAVDERWAITLLCVPAGT